MEMMGSLLGAKANPDVVLRGFLGIELIDSDDAVTVNNVLDKGPAGKSGLQKGDRLTRFQGRTVLSLEDVLRLARKLSPGDAVKLTVQRDKETREIQFKTGEGL
jgi:S1-C subfamily serine protease